MESLLDFSEGDSGCIKDFDLDERTTFRLETRGIRAGKQVKLVARQPMGPYILDVSGTRLAVGRDMVSGIRVDRFE